MLKWFNNYYEKTLKNSKQPYFIIIFLDSTHYAYNYPKKFEKNKPVIDLNNKNLAIDSSFMSKKYKTELFNRYKNSVLYVDNMFKEIMNTLNKELENNNLIVFYTGDHGEEFWEHGKFGHFNTSFIKERIETPLLFCLPEIKKNKVLFSSSIDFFPTIFDYMSDYKFKNSKKYFDGISLLNKSEADKRYLILSTYSAAGSNYNISLVNKYGKADIKYNLFRNINDSKLKYSNIRDYNDLIIKNNNTKNKIIKDIDKFKTKLTRFIKMK